MTGAYYNDCPPHMIYEFAFNNNSRFAINKISKNLLYIPVSQKIDTPNITLKVLDQ